MNTLGIIIACGKEEELAPGAEAAFLSLGNSPMIVHSLKVFEEAPVIDGVIVAVPKERVDAAVHAIKRYGLTKVCGIVVGSSTRLSTLRSVFSKMPDIPSIVVVHEASRPFVTREMLGETVKAAKRYGCAIAAHKIPDATKTAPKGMKVAGTNERNTIWAAQTPQAFKFDVLEKIINTKTKGVKIIDDESEFIGRSTEVHMVESGASNIKVRNKRDLSLATALINSHMV
jgi:2-C-methyl-D-erythritol 4-phosphate cytidylyltransferase